MSRHLLVLLLVPVMALAVVPLMPAAAQAVRVLVDGDAVASDQPPIVAAGRVLVPLRGVFERLGAFVQWNPATSTVLAIGGSNQVQLTIGSRRAFVNGQAVTLDVPAMVMGGRTLVPLRFVSEAMGARVDWDTTTRVVSIFSTQAGGPITPVPQPPISQPVPPPPAQPALVDGVVLRTDIEASRILIERDGRVHTFVVTADTAIRLVETSTGRTAATSLSQIPVGMPVQVTADAAGRAMLIRVTVQALPSERAPAIYSVVVQPTTDLEPGEVLTVTMRGDPNGQASFRIDGLTGWIPMAVALSRPGVYVGSYRIRPGDDALNARVIVQLVRGDQVTRVEAPTRVTIADADGGPSIAITSPASGTVVRTGWMVQGRAAPGHRIVVRVDYRGRAIIFETRGTLGEFTTTANASGRWAVRIDRDAPVADADLTVTATAIDQFGRQSDQAVIIVRQG